MVLTLSSTAFAHAAQPGGETVAQAAAAAPGGGGAGSVNGTESTNGAGSTDRANGADSALPAGSGENVQTGEPTAAPAPAENENEQTEDENAQDAQQNTETSDDAKADVKKKPIRNKYPNTKKDLLLTFAVRIRNSARAGRPSWRVISSNRAKKTRSTRKS